MKERLQKQYLETRTGEGIDRDLARKAFEQRFEEVRLFRMRRGLPSLLPPERTAAVSATRSGTGARIPCPRG